MTSSPSDRNRTTNMPDEHHRGTAPLPVTVDIAGSAFPDPTPEEVAEWDRRLEHAKAHPETLLSLGQVRERLSPPASPSESTERCTCSHARTDHFGVGMDYQCMIVECDCKGFASSIPVPTSSTEPDAPSCETCGGLVPNHFSFCTRSSPAFPFPL